MQDDHDEGADAASIHIPEDEIDLSDLRWEDAIVLAVFWILAIDVFLQFFTRYVLNNSLGWTEEIARYLLICVTFIGAVMAVRKRSHIAVEFLYRWVPREGRRVAQTLIDATSVIFYGGMTWLTAVLASKTRQNMVSVQIPKAWLYWLVAACFAAMACIALYNAWRHLRSGTSALIDPEAHADSTHLMD